MYCMFIAAVLILFLIIAINDFLFFRIEDSVNIAVVALFIVGMVCGVLPNYSLISALSIASLCFIVAVGLNYFELLGGGDVKLLFGVGLFISANSLVFLYALSITSLVITSAYMAKGRQIENLRKKLANKVLTQKNKMKGYSVVLHRILFPSAYNVDENEFRVFKQNTNMLKQEIPYGVILSICTISAVLGNAMNVGGI